MRRRYAGLRPDSYNIVTRRVWSTAGRFEVHICIERALCIIDLQQARRVHAGIELKNQSVVLLNAVDRAEWTPTCCADPAVTSSIITQ